MAQTTYYSQQTGDWDEPATWGGGLPGPSDHVVIQDGHSVRLRAGGEGTYITNLTIHSGGVLNADNKEMNVSGTFIVNGTYTSFEGAAQDLNFDGDSLGGSGTISVSKDTRYFIFSENAVIIPSAQLKIFGHINVGDGVTITNKGFISVSGNIDGSNATTSVWTNDAGSFAEVKGIFMSTGILNASSSGNTVKYNQQADQAITTPSSGTYYNLTTSGLGVKTISSDIIIENNLTISFGIFDCNNNNLTIKGNWLNNADFTEGTGTVSFTGTSDQSISNSDGELFYDLVVNKFSGSLILENDVTVSNALTLTSGIIETGSRVITLGTGAGNPGTLSHASGFICGSFKRWIISISAFHFPVGKQTYQPVNITLNDLALGGTLIAEFRDSDPGISGLPLYDDPGSVFNSFVDGYWSLVAGNGFDLGVTGTYDLSLDGTGFSAFSITDATRVLMRNDSGSDWRVDEGTHQSPVGNTARRSGLFTLPAEFAFGDTTNCSRPVTSAIIGSDEVCTGTTDVSYEVTDNSPNTYTWIITGGTQATGDSTNSITVDWDIVGMANANIRVFESNACTKGAPVDHPVTIHSIQPSAISGRKAVAELTSGEPYSVTGITGYNYTWTITGGIQASGDDTDSITVDWGNNGTGIVSVEADKGICASAPATEISVNKYVVIESIVSGDWDDPTTWDCNCEPLPTENVRINNGHTVTLIAGGSGTEVNNFIIEAGGVLDPNDRIMTIHGDFDHNGTYLGGNKGLVMDGFGSGINGTGTLQRGIALSANIDFLSTAVINISAGNIEIDEGIEITNYGSVTVADNVVGADAVSEWTNKSNSTLRIGAALLATGILNASSSGNTVNYNGTGNQSIKSPVSGNYYNLTTSGGGIKSLTSNLDVNGELTLNGSAVLDVTTSFYSINLAGDWINSGGTFNEQSGLVVFDGSADQNITGVEIFYDLSYTNSSGLYLNNNISVSNTLAMAGGNIYPLANTLTIGTGAGIPGSLSYTSGIVAGKLERWAASTGVGYLYPIGTSSIYRPASITYNALGTGSLLFEFVSADPGSAGLPISEGTVNVIDTYSEGYWNAATTNGLTTTDFNIQLTATDFSSYSIIPGTRVIRDTIGGNWVLDGTHAAASDPDLYRNNLTYGISDTGTVFGIGHVECTGISLDKTITNVSCNGYSDGAIDITVNGGTAPYTYVWGHGPVTEDVSGLAAGSYTVTATDYDGCTIDSTWTVTEPFTLSIPHSETNVNCNGGSTGSIDITPTGGTAPYTFSWSHGPATEDVSGLTAGSYTITLTDNNACTLDSTIDITEPAALTATINSTDVTCNGVSDGTITLSAPSGGSGVYEYSINGGGAWQASTDFTGLNGGSYDIRIQDQAAPGCFVVLDGAYLIDEPLAITINRVITNVSCIGGNNGAIDITPSGGTPGYIFSWSHGPTTEDVNTLTAGSYIVTLTDGNGCTLDSTFTVTEPTALVINKAITNVTCNAGNDGAIDITPSGGTLGYTFSWSHGPITEDVGTLTTGNYTVTLTDANGCTLDSTFAVTEPTARVINKAITDVTCKAGIDGTIDITPSGGTPGYTFNWSHGPTTEDVNTLTAGSYTITLTDGNGCTLDSTFAVTEPTALVINKAITNATCNAGNNGAIDITPSGGTPGYTFSWSHGPTTEDVNTLTAGSYTITLTDANGCTLDSTFAVTEPTARVINKAITDVTCKAGIDGTIDITPSGGTPGYTFNWSHGPTTEDVNTLTAGSYIVTLTDGNGCTLDSTFTVTEPTALVINKAITNVTCNAGNDGAIDITPSGGTLGYTFSWSHGPITEDVGTLTTGNYTVTLTDGNGCTLDSTFTVTEPTALVINKVITDVLCNGGNTGAIDITPTGGAGGYTFSWSDGPTTEDVSGLSAGSYTVTLTDANSCTLDSTFTVSEPLTSIIIDRIITVVSTVGGSDGAIDITPSGGIPGYTFNWSNGPATEDVSGLSSGIYTVFVTDANNCTLDSTFYVTEPNQIFIARTITNVSCNGGNNGEIDLYIVGGTPGYTYSWSHGPIIQDVTGLTAGIYSVTVTDALGISVDSTFTVAEPSPMVINRVISDVSCFNGSDGTIDVTVSGGTAGYTYSWSHGPINEDVDTLAAGSFTLTVTDANLCTLDSTYIVAEPTALIIDRVITNVSCNSGSDGSIDINVGGGTLDYTFSWSHGPIIEDVGLLTAGSYTVTITDASGCELDSTFFISEQQAAQPPILATSDRDSICPGDGTIMLSFTEGLPGPGDTAEWYEDDQFTQHIGSGNDLIVSAPLMPITYYVRYEGDCGVSDSAFVSVQVKTVSIEPDSAMSNPDFICAGDEAIVLSYSGGNLGAGAIAVWYSDSLLTEYVGSGNNLNIVAPDSTSTYFVRFEGDCNITQQAKVKVSIATESVRPDTAYVDKDTICAGDGQIILTYEGGVLGTGAEAIWYSDPGLTTNIGVGNNLNITSPLVQTTYYVRFEGDCNTTDAKPAFINVNLKPAPELIEKVELVCAGSQPVWYVVAGDNNSSFLWNLTGGNINNNLNDSILVQWDDVPGIYQLTVLEIGESGCQSDSLNLNVEVSAPTVDLGPDLSICEGEEATITPAGNFINQMWHDGSGSQDYLTSVAGMVSVLVENESGCQATDSLWINVIANPEVNLGSDTILCGESSLILDGGNEGTSYNWSTGETTQQITVYMGRQVISVTVASEYGCSGGDTITILECSTDVLFDNIPNVFTPNGDNFNDTWYFVEAAAFPEMVIEIYDRWGKLVWRSGRGYPEPWDGRSLSGAEMPVDSYYYVIDLNDGSEQIVGTITIVK